MKYVLDTPLTDCSNMLKNCENLGNIDFSYFNSSLITNMSSMLMNCGNLNIYDLSDLKTSSITGISFMIYHSTIKIDLFICLTHLLFY